MKIKLYSHLDFNSYSPLSLIWEIFSLQFIKNVTTNCCAEIQEQSLKQIYPQKRMFHIINFEDTICFNVHFEDNK